MNIPEKDLQALEKMRHEAAFNKAGARIPYGMRPSSAWVLFAACLVTLGAYVPVWYLRMREMFNNLGGEYRFDDKLAWFYGLGIFVAFPISFVFGQWEAISAILEMYGVGQLPPVTGNTFLLVALPCHLWSSAALVIHAGLALVYWKALHDRFPELEIKPFPVVLCGCLYLQAKINEACLGDLHPLPEVPDRHVVRTKIPCRHSPVQTGTIPENTN